MNEGWVCPKCGTVYAPLVTGCNKCNAIHTIPYAPMPYPYITPLYPYIQPWIINPNYIPEVTCKGTTATTKEVKA